MTEDTREARTEAVRALEAEFGELVNRFRRIITENAHRVSPGLLPGAYKVFTTIVRREPVTTSALAEILTADKGQISRTVRELEELDFDDVAGSGLTKKELLVLRREKDKLAKTLGGIRDMPRTPQAVWIVDTKKEHLAVDEARKLRIPVIGILDTPADVVDPGPAGTPLPDTPVTIDFDRVGFAYPTGPPVLVDIALHIAPNTRLAVVGETGSGKTTLAKLLTRLMDPTSGAVRLDGRDLREVPFDSLRERVVMVPQEGFLFDSTLRANALYGRLDATDDDILHAVDQLGLRDWLDGLPRGLDTRVGQRGESLSAGERQLVALLRAHLADPDLLVLDEATSAVDPALEMRIGRALERLMTGRTSVTIAHRLSTAETADEVVVVDKGRIVQRGPHLLGREDTDVAEAVAEILVEDGVELLLDTHATGVAAADGGVALTVAGPGGERTIEGSHLLVAAGRVPNTDALGLDAMDRRYLRRMAEHHNGGPVGVETLAAALAEARDTLEDVIEPYLIQEGLMLRTSRGRMLGEPGWRHLGLMPPSTVPGQPELLDLLTDPE